MLFRDSLFLGALCLFSIPSFAQQTGSINVSTESQEHQVIPSAIAPAEFIEEGSSLKRSNDRTIIPAGVETVQGKNDVPRPASTKKKVPLALKIAIPVAVVATVIIILTSKSDKSSGVVIPDPLRPN